MPFCPKCRSEFVEGTSLCEDCGVPLLSGPPPDEQPADPAEDLVEIWRAQGEINAQLVRSLLEGSGIRSMLSGETLRLTHGLTIDGLALVRIFVRAEDAARAADIISSIEGVRKCPACGRPVSESDGSCWSCGAEIGG
jgi:predicted amidophosphoribosyltransferase